MKHARRSFTRRVLPLVLMPGVIGAGIVSAKTPAEFIAYGKANPGKLS